MPKKKGGSTFLFGFGLFICSLLKSPDHQTLFKQPVFYAVTSLLPVWFFIFGPASHPHLSVFSFEAEYEVCFRTKSSVFWSPGL